MVELETQNSKFEIRIEINDNILVTNNNILKGTTTTISVCEAEGGWLYEIFLYQAP